MSPAAGRSAAEEAGRTASSVREHPPSRVRRSGRRPGDSGTREAILSAARAAFAEQGYDKATIRGIAARAAVDPALVLHYFGSKERLFGAALQIPFTPGEVLRTALGADPDRLGEVIVRAFLNAWEPAETRPALIAMVRSAMTNDVAQAMVREFLDRRVFGPDHRGPSGTGCGPACHSGRLAVHRAGDDRYVVGFEPMESASVDQIVAAVGPTVQRYLSGDLEGP